MEADSRDSSKERSSKTDVPAFVDSSGASGGPLQDETSRRKAWSPWGRAAERKLLRQLSPDPYASSRFQNARDKYVRSSQPGTWSATNGSPGRPPLGHSRFQSPTPKSPGTALASFISKSAAFIGKMSPGRRSSTPTNSKPAERGPEHPWLRSHDRFRSHSQPRASPAVTSSSPLDPRHTPPSTRSGSALCVHPDVARYGPPTGTFKGLLSDLTNSLGVNLRDTPSPRGSGGMEGQESEYCRRPHHSMTTRSKGKERRHDKNKRRSEENDWGSEGAAPVLTHREGAEYASPFERRRAAGTVLETRYQMVMDKSWELYGDLSARVDTLRSQRSVCRECKEKLEQKLAGACGETVENQEYLMRLTRDNQSMALELTRLHAKIKAYKMALLCMEKVAATTLADESVSLEDQMRACQDMIKSVVAWVGLSPHQYEPFPEEVTSTSHEEGPGVLWSPRSSVCGLGSVRVPMRSRNSSERFPGQGPSWKDKGACLEDISVHISPPPATRKRSQR